MTDVDAALSALRRAIEEREAYHARFLATAPLPSGVTPEGPRIDLDEVKRLDELVCRRGHEYELAWAEAGRPVWHYSWMSPDLSCE